MRDERENQVTPERDAERGREGEFHKWVAVPQSQPDGNTGLGMEEGRPVSGAWGVVYYLARSDDLRLAPFSFSYFSSHLKNIRNA